MSTTPVGKALEKVIWEVHQCEKILEHGAPSEDRLLDKLDHLVGVLPSLREAAKESEAADDDKGSATVFPVDILRHVDEGRNPVRFMVDAILAVGEANAATKGKSNVFKKFNEELERENAAQPRVDGPRRGDGEGRPRAGDPDPAQTRRAMTRRTTRPRMANRQN